MIRFFCISTVIIVMSGNLLGQANPVNYLDNWHQWRGPSALGVAPSGNPPLTWNENSNIKWKSEIPGIGHSTPIIWKNQIILLTAVQTDQEVKLEEAGSDQEGNEWMAPISTNFIHEFTVISINGDDGSIQWQTIVRKELPHSHTHQFGSWASGSPVTDGEKIFAYFGSHGLYCLNMKGDILWERDFDFMQKIRSFGEGSSPALFNDRLILLRDHEGQSTLHVLNTSTGEDILEIKRDERSSWSTPYMVDFKGITQIITSATNKIRSYNFHTGEVLWEVSGLTRNVIPCPVMANDIVYFMSGFRGNALLAVDITKASGDISGSDAIVWKYEINTPYTPSPVLMEDKLYFLKANNGYLTCLSASDGKEFYSSQKLEGIQNIFTSPVGVMDRLYITGTNGTTCVVKAGSEFEILSENTLDDKFYASPVIIGNSIYLRGIKSLYCISGE